MCGVEGVVTLFLQDNEVRTVDISTSAHKARGDCITFFNDEEWFLDGERTAGAVLAVR